MFDAIAYSLIALSVMATETFQQLTLAYLGPGGAISTIGTILALIAAVVVAFIGFFWYPIKRLLGRKKTLEPDAVPNTED